MHLVMTRIQVAVVLSPKPKLQHVTCWAHRLVLCCLQKWEDKNLTGATHSHHNYSHPPSLSLALTHALGGTSAGLSTF